MREKFEPQNFEKTETEKSEETDDEKEHIKEIREELKTGVEKVIKGDSDEARKMIRAMLSAHLEDLPFLYIQFDRASNKQSNLSRKYLRPLRMNAHTQAIKVKETLREQGKDALNFLLEYYKNKNFSYYEKVLFFYKLTNGWSEFFDEAGELLSIDKQDEFSIYLREKLYREKEKKMTYERLWKMQEFIKSYLHETLLNIHTDYESELIINHLDRFNYNYIQIKLTKKKGLNF